MLTRLGDTEIWRILECVTPFAEPQAFFPDVEAGELAEALATEAPRQLCPDSGRILLPIQGFLVRSPQKTILIDACVGNDKTFPAYPDWNRKSDGRFFASLAAAGAAPDDIDIVMCTHLHVDHVGWNTRLIDGRWVPTFAKARYLFPAADAAHYGAKPGAVFSESVLPVIAAGQADMVGPGYRIDDHVELIATPGHTPGHVSVRITGGGRELVISGDALHSPIQCRHPDWCPHVDLDKPQARASRRALLDSVADSGARFVGSHFPLPSTGRIERQGDSFSWRED